MELKLPFHRAPEQDSRTNDEEFVLELTLDELGSVGGARRYDDESPKE
jgi:hypothetical protein